MNITRGLFRAWVVFSALWALGAGSFATVTVWQDTVQGKFQPEGAYSKPFSETRRSPLTEKLSITFIPHYETDMRMVSIKVDLDGSILYIGDGYSLDDMEYVAHQFVGQRWTRYAGAAGTVALWAFVPCIMVFILGYALLWVGRGFAQP